MALPLVLLAAKAGALAKTARPVLAEWNRLPPDAKTRLRREASDVTRTLNKLRRALGARLFGAGDREISWEEARSVALNPRPEFVMAKEIVQLVRAGGEVDEDELRSHFAGGRHSGFEQALGVAAEDGYIQRLSSGRWGITAFADLDLVDSDEVRFIERSIVEHVNETGLAGREELALSVGAPEPHAGAFLAALERALASREIDWLGPGLYGLPRSALAAMEPPAASAPEAPADSGAIKSIIGELGREIADLRAAIARERAGGLSPGAPASPAEPGVAAFAQAAAPMQAGGRQGDPIDLLRRLKELVDVGILTPQEFERKKAEVLAQM